MRLSTRGSTGFLHVSRVKHRTWRLSQRVRANRGDSIDAPGSTNHEVRQMATIAIGTIEELEALAAWHRANAEHAGSDWVWEARLRTAEDLERQAADLRARGRYADKGRGAGAEPANQAVRQN